MGPDNCRWATQTQQANNRTNNVVIEGRSISEHAKELGVSYKAAYYQLRGKFLSKVGSGNMDTPPYL